MNLLDRTFSTGPSPHARAHGEELFTKIVASRNRKKIELATNVQTGIKRVRRADLQFITVVAPPLAEQPVRMLDVTVDDETPAWRRGLNKLPTELESKMVAALQRELDKSGLYLDKLPDGTVGLHTDVARREGDEVCSVTGLLYDSIANITNFLSQGGNKVLVDRLLEIRGLAMNDGEEGSVYMAITGVARYIRHYLGVRRGGPNVVLKVQASKGCGDGLVSCIVQTRNGVGIAARSPIVMNYGNEYDLNVAATAAASDEGDAKRFRGVLDEYFAKQQQWAADSKPAEGTNPPTPAPPQGEQPKPPAPGPPAPPKPPGQPKPAPKPTPTPAPTPPKPDPIPEVPPEKKVKTGEVELGTITSPIMAKLILQNNERLVLRPDSTVQGSKKVAPKTVVAKCKDGKVQKQSSTAIGGKLAWSFKSAATTLVVNPAGQVVKLADFCDSVSCKNIARHKGTGQSLAIQGDPLAFDAAEAQWQASIRLAKDMTQLTANYMVKKKTDGDEVVPVGIALTIAKQIIVKAGEDLILQ